MFRFGNFRCCVHIFVGGVYKSGGMDPTFLNLRFFLALAHSDSRAKKVGNATTRG